MDRLVLPLPDVAAEDAPLVGGKAAKRAALARAGFPVPPSVRGVDGVAGTAPIG